MKYFKRNRTIEKRIFVLEEELKRSNQYIEELKRQLENETKIKSAFQRRHYQTNEEVQKIIEHLEKLLTGGVYYE